MRAFKEGHPRTQWEWIAGDPFAKVSMPNPIKKRVRYLSPDEEKKLYKALADKLLGFGWLLPIITLARKTGGAIWCYRSETVRHSNQTT